MKNNFRKAALSTICMLIVAVMSLTGVTYAWFSAGETADVTGMTMNVAAADGGFQVSLNGTDWTSTVNFNKASGSLNPVSTVDALTFYTGKVDTNDASGNKITTTEDTSKANVWTQVFYAKNTGYTAVDVYLASGEIFKDINAEDSKLAYKAARLAVFVDKDGDGNEFENELVYIWGAGSSNYGISGAGEIADCTVPTEGFVADVPALKTDLTDCSFELAGMKVQGNTATAYVATITLVLWIEGQDSDCINQNASDTFNVDLDLTVVKPGI